MGALKEKPRSMADIAEMLGVTAVSVSLALRNSPLISQELRDQVQKIANETGFKARNYRRRNVAEKKLPFDGKIMVVDGNLFAGDPVVQQIMNSVMKRLSDLRASFKVCSCDELYVNPDLAAGSAGVIFHYCFQPSFSSIFRGIPQVAIMHEEIEMETCDNYKPDERLAGKLAANYLLNQGFRNVLLTWEHKMAYRAKSHPRLEGFRQEIRETGGNLSELAYGSEDDPQLYFRELKERLAAFGNRAGIFAFNDLVAYKVCHTLNFLGLERKPRELEVVSCDNTFLIQGLQPSLPVVDLHISEIAERAVDGLFWRLEHPDACFQEVMLKPELVLPQSE